MARILITSGPTREYLDPVRYLTNGSSGQMGRAMAAAAIEAGHSVVVVSGPVAIEYPPAAEVIFIISTAEMLAACRTVFADCDGMIAVAAPCDFRPLQVQPQKIHKTGAPLHLELHETPDILASLAAERRTGQWLVGFALETDDQRSRARSKLRRKQCDLIVLNGPEAIGVGESSVEILDPAGKVVAALDGPKGEIALGIMRAIEGELLSHSRVKDP
jgi:phosphopantothenoylcysteine decarboxylase/phosphopantothenate--cysteine ligase